MKSDKKIAKPEYLTYVEHIMDSNMGCNMKLQTRKTKGYKDLRNKNARIL